jgi:hypothetical protein
MAKKSCEEIDEKDLTVLADSQRPEAGTRDEIRIRSSPISTPETLGCCDDVVPHPDWAVSGLQRDMTAAVPR